MTCSYCRAHNEEDAHRCNRCGRRLTQTTGPVFASRAATAPALSPVNAPAEAPAAAAPPAPSLRLVPPAQAEPSQTQSAQAVQASLFGPQAVPRGPANERRQVRTPSAPPRQKREKFEHPKLDFGGDTIRTLRTSVAAAIYSDAPVALASYRIAATAIDTTIGLAGLMLFVGTFRAAGFEFDSSRQSLLTLALAGVLISMLYRALFAVAGGDTLGLRMTNLRLVHFYGHLPSRKDRALRLLGGCISFFALAIGLIWAIGDEERLTWHDHISKTFPTMIDPHAN